jgi:hypothetical protein
MERELERRGLVVEFQVVRNFCDFLRQLAERRPFGGVHFETGVDNLTVQTHNRGEDNKSATGPAAPASMEETKIVTLTKLGGREHCSGSESFC